MASLIVPCCRTPSCCRSWSRWSLGPRRWKPRSVGAVKEAAASAVPPAPPTSSGYNPHASLYGVGDEQTSGGVDLLILLLNVLGYLLQHLTPAGGEEGGRIRNFRSSLLPLKSLKSLTFSYRVSMQRKMRYAVAQARQPSRYDWPPIFSASA